MENERIWLRRIWAGLGLLAVVLLMTALAYYPPLYASGYTPVTAAAQPQIGVEEKVNLNTADEARLQVLPGIGPARAQAIVAYRKTHGAFSSVEELLEVKGIGEKILAEIRDYVFV